MSVLSLTCLAVLTPVRTQRVPTCVLVLKGCGLAQTIRHVEVNTCNCHLYLHFTSDNMYNLNWSFLPHLPLKGENLAIFGEI